MSSRCTAFEALQRHEGLRIVRSPSRPSAPTIHEGCVADPWCCLRDTNCSSRHFGNTAVHSGGTSHDPSVHLVHAGYLPDHRLHISWDHLQFYNDQGVSMGFRDQKHRLSACPARRRPRNPTVALWSLCYFSTQDIKLVAGLRQTHASAIPCMDFDSGESTGAETDGKGRIGSVTAH